MLKRDELSTEEGCILWGSRLVVPPSCQKPVLDFLHQCHPGITHMKSLARSYVWWPNMDHALENITKQCDPCQFNKNNPSKAPLHPRMWPSRPWSRLHLDYAGPFMGKMFLVTVDALSKWLDICPILLIPPMLQSVI